MCLCVCVSKCGTELLGEGNLKKRGAKVGGPSVLKTDSLSLLAFNARRKTGRNQLPAGLLSLPGHHHQEL